MKQVLLACICILAISAGCKKGDSKSRTELLAQASWKYADAGLDANRDGTIDSPVPPGFLQDCDLDNTITFNTNGTGVVDEGASKCDPSNPQSEPFSWTFKNNEQVITFSNISFGGLNGDVTVKTISGSQLELHKEINMGFLVNVIVVLRH